MRRPKVKLDNLVALIVVEEKRDLTSAANQLGLTTSAVRKQIDCVERILGVSLFEGRRGRLEPTADGEVFLSEARNAVEHALLAEEKTLAGQSLKAHHLLVGHSTYLAPQLIRFLYKLRIEESPRVRIEHFSGLTPMIIHRVVDGSLHAGVGFLPIVQPELLVRSVYDEPVMVCLPSDHRLAQRTLIYPNDLEGEPVIALSRETLPLLHREIEEHLREFGVGIRVVADAFAPPEAVSFVLQKIGICFVAASSVIPCPGITLKPLSTRVLIRKSGVFIREDNRTPIVAKLIETMLRDMKGIRRNNG